MRSSHGGISIKGRIRPRPAAYSGTRLHPLASELTQQRQTLRRAMAGFGLSGASAENPADETDQAVAEQEVAFAFLLKQRARTRLEQVEQAMQRLRSRSYGLCQDCGRQIPLERLRVQPDAVHCVPCKSRQEARAQFTRG